MVGCINLADLTQKLETFSKIVLDFLKILNPFLLSGFRLQLQNKKQSQKKNHGFFSRSGCPNSSGSRYPR